MHDEIRSRNTLHCPPMPYYHTNFRNECNCADHNIIPCVKTKIDTSNWEDAQLEEMIGFNYYLEYDENASTELNEELRVTNDRNRFKLYNACWSAMCHTCPLKYNVYNDRSQNKHKRVRLPKCLESVIRSLYPEYSGWYTGFKSRR